MDYNVQYFIDKFSAIPELNWVERLLGHDGHHCALGHCGVKALNLKGEILGDNPEANALAKLLYLVNAEKKTAYIVGYINDGFHPQYQQRSPKQRILAALYDIKIMQDKENTVVPEPKVKKEYISVRVSETIYDGIEDRVMS